MTTLAASCRVHVALTLIWQVPKAMQYGSMLANMSIKLRKAGDSTIVFPLQSVVMCLALVGSHAHWAHISWCLPGHAATESSVYLTPGACHDVPYAN